MRIVVDTNVLVSGLLNPRGAPGRIVDLITAADAQGMRIVGRRHSWPRAAAERYRRNVRVADESSQSHARAGLR